MCKEQDIIIKDGISIVQMRTLLETTKTMSRALNQNDFVLIMSIYGEIANRLLEQNH